MINRRFEETEMKQNCQSHASLLMIGRVEVGVIGAPGTDEEAITVLLAVHEIAQGVVLCGRSLHNSTAFREVLQRFVS